MIRTAQKVKRSVREDYIEGLRLQDEKGLNGRNISRVNENVVRVRH